MARQHVDVLIIDDEDKFRVNLRKRLETRSLSVHDVDRGEDAIKLVRKHDYDVVLLDLRMPGLSGEETLREIRKVNQTSQVIIVTGHATFRSATVAGKHDAFSYLEKPVEMDQLLSEIEAAKRHKLTAKEREEQIPDRRPSLKKRLMGVAGYRPLFILVGLALFAALVLLPTPQSMIDVVSHAKTGAIGDPTAGYADHRSMAPGQTIADFYGKSAKLIKGADGYL
ncbi:MAG: response regulator, partial [Deltaproteobacteria bacterium]|nr:response regulator [Deltaproteobacteria bacterium]MBW2533520.1 response regulator [Deltaproteobacteria bacterium]